MDDLRPLPHDPAAFTVERMVDLHGQGWVVSAPGDYSAAAVEGFNRDGSGVQHLVAIEVPGRVMHTDELVQVKLLLHPDDALGLAKVVAHTARWMQKFPAPGAGPAKSER